MDLNKLCASKIKETRILKSLTSEFVANELGIDKSNYSKLENGRVEITLKKVEAISKILNVNVSTLLPINAHTIQITNGEHSPNVQNITNNSDKELIESIVKTLSFFGDALIKKNS